MLRTLLLFLLFAHGAIHLLGLVKAFAWAPITQLTRPISRSMGIAWGLAAMLFVVAAVLLLLHSDRWWMVALAAVVLSQVLIVRYGHQANFGKVANVLVLVAVIVGAGMWNFRRAYTAAVHHGVERTRGMVNARITEEDLLPLPLPVQRYLRTSGVVGSARPHSMRITFAGAIRAVDGPWLPFTTVQTNFFDSPTRLFWMDATMKGFPVKGLHAYADRKATMLIKAVGLVPVKDAKGPELDTAETVTYFNDLCLFAPGALLDPRITWAPIDDRSARATFTNEGIVVHAELRFDAAGHLIDFLSDDRAYTAPDGTMHKYRFSTPMRDHRLVNGHLLPAYGETVYDLPSGAFTYGKFNLQSIEYDVGD